MTDQTQSSAATLVEPQRRGRARRILFILLVVLTAGFTGAVASQAISSGYGPGGWHHPWHGRGLMGRLDPAFIEDRADRIVRHAAIEIDATPEQQEKVRSIVKSAVRDMLPMREKMFAARQRARTLLTQPTVDRAAIETFRAEQLAQADAFSKRLAQALADAAEVLTPEQRNKIAAFVDMRRSFWRRGHRD